MPAYTDQVQIGRHLIGALLAVTALGVLGVPSAPMVAAAAAAGLAKEHFEAAGTSMPFPLRELTLIHSTVLSPERR